MSIKGKTALVENDLEFKEYERGAAQHILFQLPNKILNLDVRIGFVEIFSLTTGNCGRFPTLSQDQGQSAQYNTPVSI